MVIEGRRRMKTPLILRQVEAYWEGLRPFGGLPTRDQINPRGLDSALDYAFLLDKPSTGECTFRLGGERLGDILGIALDRVPLLAMLSQADQPTLRSALNSVFEEPAIMRAELSSEDSIMRPEFDANLLLLPLKAADDEITQSLGVLHFDGPIGRSPRQFNRISHNLTRLVLTEKSQTSANEPEPLGMAEAPAAVSYESGRPVGSGRPQLKVIKGGLK